MPTIGILLPGSTLYPSIGMDFMQGTRSCFAFHQYEPVNIQATTIGFGVKDDEIYAAAEKLLIIDNADAVVVYAGDHHAEKLAPLFAAAGKLLIVVNAGASYPVNTSALTNTVFHSFNDCLFSFLTGKYAARQEGGHGAIMATSFFDGGYSHSYAMNTAFVHSGGEIKHNFVSHFKKEEFATAALTDFIKNNPDVKKMMTVFSGDMARLFYERLLDIQQGSKLQWYGSPMMFDCSPGDFAEPKPAVPGTICGYTGWVPGLDNEINRSFIQYYKEAHTKDANLFSMQGWENALLLMQYLETRKTTANTGLAIEQLKAKEISSPRGTVVLNARGYTMGPAHFVQASGNLQVSVTGSITSLSEAWDEMCTQIPTEIISSWRNTYLCI